MLQPGSATVDPGSATADPGSATADDFRDEYAFLLKKSENQDDFLKSLFFDLQECVIPQKNPQKNRHSILK